MKTLSGILNFEFSMKSSLTTITAFSIIAMLAGAVNAMPTEQSQQLNPTQIPPKGQTNSTPKVNQTTEQFDLPLLVKTGTAFFQSDRYQTESQMEVNGGNQGANFTFHIQTKTIVQSGRKFRAEIAFTRPGEPAKPANLLISNGQQVWIYRPDLRQYAVTSYKAFENSDDSFLIGLSSSLFMVLPEDARQQVAQGQLSNTQVLQEMGLANNKLLKGDRRTIEGETLYVYKYTDPKEGLAYTAFVQPETATPQQLQIAGKSQGLDILIAEKILSRSANPAITQQTFTFSPPQGSKQVKSLSLSPF